MGRNIILLGPPGAGKGTQADMLSRHFNLEHISTGEILRKEIARNTELGQKARVFMDKGNLVPDDLVFQIVEEELGNNKKDGALLDGFPRNLRQAEMLDEQGIAVEKVLYIKVSEEEIVRRLSKRRYCEVCDKVVPYDDEFCLVCSSQMVMRSDDKPEVIRERLKVYRDSTEPLIRYYRKKGLLAEINGLGSVREIHKRMVNTLVEVQSG